MRRVPTSILLLNAQSFIIKRPKAYRRGRKTSFRNGGTTHTTNTYLGMNSPSATEHLCSTYTRNISQNAHVSEMFFLRRPHWTAISANSAWKIWSPFVLPQSVSSIIQDYCQGKTGVQYALNPCRSRCAISAKSDWY